MNLSTARKLKADIVPLNSTDTDLVAANGEPICVLGKATVPVNIADDIVDFEFYVCDNVTHSVLIGIDMLRKCNAVIDLANNSISFGDETRVLPLVPRYPAECILRAVNSIIIPPNHEVDVEVYIPSGYELQQSIVEPLLINRRHGMLTARALVHPARNRTWCRVINIQDYACSLKRNSAIAAILPATEVIEPDEPTEDPLCNAEMGLDTGSDTKNASLTYDQKLHKLRELDFKIEQDNLTDEQHRQLVSLIYEYRDVFDTDLPGVRDFKYEIKLRPDVEPRRAKPIRYNPEMRKVIDKQLGDWERQGIISEGPYKYAHPLVLVKRQCGCNIKVKGRSVRSSDCTHPPQFRLVSDLRLLNQALIQEPFYVGSLSEIIEDFGDPSPSWFSVLDAQCGYLQCELSENSKPLLGIQTSNKSYVYNRLCFGLTVSGYEYCRLLAKVLRGYTHLFTNNYIDDNLVYSHSFSDHMTHTRLILDRYRSFRLRLKASKAVLAKNEIPFLGAILSKEGHRPNPRKVQLIEKMGPPTNQKLLKSYLGLTNFFRRYIY